MLQDKVGSNRNKFIGRKKLLWDGDTMRIKNLEVANQFVKRQYRSGWKLT